MANDSVYGSCVKDGALNLSLIRSAAYCAHPIFDRPLVPQDRYMPHMDLGETVYEFAIKCGEVKNVEEAIPRMADVLNEKPYALAFSHREQRAKRENALLLLKATKLSFRSLNLLRMEGVIL